MILAVIQARMNSSRLPGKSLMNICGKPVLQRAIERLQTCELLQPPLGDILVATTILPEDWAIIKLASSLGVKSYSGSSEDVLDRYYRATKEMGASTIVRITGDCPLVDSAVVQAAINYFQIREDLDFLTDRPSYPDGLDVEIFNFISLERAWREATEREHFTQHFLQHPERFQIEEMRFDADLSYLPKLSVDTQEDLERVSKVFAILGDYASLADILCLQEVAWE